MPNIFKAIGHGFQKVGSVIVHIFKDHAAEVQTQIKALVVEAIEGVTHVDLNGDGKVDTIATMIPTLTAMAIQYGWTDLGYLGQAGVDLGIPAASKILAEVLPTADLKSWLAITNMAPQLAALGDKIPLSGLRFAVEAAVSELKQVTAEPATAVEPTPADLTVTPLQPSEDQLKP